MTRKKSKQRCNSDSRFVRNNASTHSARHVTNGFLDTRWLVSGRTSEGLSVEVFAYWMLSSPASSAWLSIRYSSQPSASSGFEMDMITLLACTTAAVLSPSLPFSRTHWLPPPSAARSKSSSYWTSVIVLLPDLSDILPTTSCTPPGTNLALGRLSSRLSCNYSNCFWRAPVFNPRVTKAPSHQFIILKREIFDLRARSGIRKMVFVSVILSGILHTVRRRQTGWLKLSHSDYTSKVPIENKL